MGHVLVRCRPSVMFSRTVLFVSPACTGQVRGMATLRDIQNRLKAVKNIQKITKSMKIVSAAKFNKAERELKCARPYGHGAKAFFDSAEVTQDESKPVHLVVACSSDRGLCGGIHSNRYKTVVSYATEAMPIYSKDAVSSAGKLHQYDSIDDDVLLATMSLLLLT